MHTQLIKNALEHSFMKNATLICVRYLFNWIASLAVGNIADTPRRSESVIAIYSIVQRCKWLWHVPIHMIDIYDKLDVRSRTQTRLVPLTFSFSALILSTCLNEQLLLSVLSVYPVFIHEHTFIINVLLISCIRSAKQIEGK